MHRHSHGDATDDAIDLVAAVVGMTRRGSSELSRSIGEITRAVLSPKVPGETFGRAFGRSAEVTKRKAEVSSRSPDEIARSVLFVQSVYETRYEAAANDPSRPGTPDVRELKAQAGVARSFRRAYEARLGHDIETGQPVPADHAKSVDPALKKQAMLLETNGSCAVVDKAQALYDEAVGGVQKARGQKTHQEQRKAA